MLLYLASAWVCRPRLQQAIGWKHGVHHHQHPVLPCGCQHPEGQHLVAVGPIVGRNTCALGTLRAPVLCCSEHGGGPGETGDCWHPRPASDEESMYLPQAMVSLGRSLAGRSRWGRSGILQILGWLLPAL